MDARLSMNFNGFSVQLYRVFAINGLLVSDDHIHSRYMCKVGYRSKEP